MEWTRSGLAAAGFTGFVAIGVLDVARVPSGPGVYIVLRDPAAPPVFFLDSSPAGWFKGKDPSVSALQLQAAWVPDTDVLYLGRAEPGKRCNRGLAARLKELQRFGQGAAIGHWGGRYLWQIKDSDQLLVAWQESCDPPTREAELVEQFVTAWGARPFANRNRPQRRPIPSRSRAD